jgi:hypothetical protein
VKSQFVLNVQRSAEDSFASGLYCAEFSQSVQPSYEAMQRLMREFEQEFGGRDCHVLLGCDLNTREGQALFRERRLGERRAKYTSKAAETAARIISEATGHKQ